MVLINQGIVFSGDNKTIGILADGIGAGEILIIRFQIQIIIKWIGGYLGKHTYGCQAGALLCAGYYPAGSMDILYFRKPGFCFQI